MIWTTDGTGAGTVPLKPLNSGVGFGGFLGAAGAGNRIYFVGGDPVHGVGLWTSTGTRNTTVLLKAVNPVSTYYTSDDEAVTETVPGAAFGGNFYFAVRGKFTGEGIDHQLWKTDGSPSGTVALTRVAGPDGLSPRDLLVRDNTLFFGGEDAVHNRELWQLPLA